MKLLGFGDIEQYLAAKRPDINMVNWFFSLEMMKDFMSTLGNPQNKYRAVHVAGTSGKTSTCYYISKMLELSGQNVGLSVSPHVDHVSERAQINNQPLTEKEFTQYFAEFVELKAVQSVEITYFGLMAAFAFWIFDQKKVDYSVIEVGMGGRLDATNVIDRQDKICVITDIGLDHTKFLGDTLPQIAREKAGIITDDNDVFVSQQADEVMQVFRSVCEAKSARLHILETDVADSAPVFLPPFQRRNWVLAKSVYDFIATRENLSPLDAKVQALAAATNIPARMEQLDYHGKKIIVDGSHNAQKIAALVAGLKQKYPNQSIALLVAFVEGKDSTIQESLDILSSVSSDITLTEFDLSQDIKRSAIDSEVLAKAALKSGFTNIKSIRDPETAFKNVTEKDVDVVVVTGSFFLLNHIRPNLKIGN